MTPAENHFLAGKRIIVAGAGMAGLAFVTGLRRQWNPALQPPEIVIYERDTQQTSINREGFSLSLAGYDETGGLYALKQLGLLDEVLPHALLGLEGTGSFKVWGRNFGEQMSVRYKPARGLPSAGIRIARKNLRKVLLDAVEATDKITWGSACVEAQKLASGRVRVKFARGGHDSKVDDEDECDLLVVADGASSKLRACLRPDDTLRYAGAIQLGGSAKFEDKIPQPVDNNWGMLLSGQGVSCFLSPIDHHSVVWALSRLEAQERRRINPNDPGSAEKVIREGLELGRMFGEPFQTIVERTDPATVFAMPARDKQPFYHDVSDLGPIVFIGDSNHAVSPFAGYGASLAMKDGWDLAEQICAASDVKRAVTSYDAISVPRAIKVLKESHWRIEMGHSTGIKGMMFRCFIAVGGFLLWLTGQA
ncbi:hypothetical protein DL766_007265 [Monosporascus sp. MC13-8B]|uniref:FAD-binding domain-containing protein n=1 Tax=Monosporascus cannonballus TaxID=155416 RepID=A0ABY0H0Z0_9PEZI|nr:hypothetical protein DL762_006825 [Monosporascus cannonballus]RYO83366.1 hypothetical protein DL763_007901 [Monosporascus cannonballus]RYP24571.1 hypothetical protein DL766_007265 [Monosporascus sp. MC13-8B]